MVRTLFLERSGSYVSTSQEKGYKAFQKSTVHNCHFSPEVNSLPPDLDGVHAFYFNRHESL